MSLHAKNAQFQGRAEEAQKEKFGGKVWQCIREDNEGLYLPPLEMKKVIPVLVQLQHKINGGEDTSQQFSISVSLEELEKVRQRPLRSQMDDLSTMEELVQAVGMLKI